MKELRRASLHPGGPGTSSKATGRSEQQRRGVRRWLGTGASAELSCAAGTSHSKWQPLSHTGTTLPAQRRRALPARTKRSSPQDGGSTRWNLVLQAIRLSGSLVSHGHTFWDKRRAHAPAEDPRAVLTVRVRAAPPCSFPPPLPRLVSPPSCPM